MTDLKSKQCALRELAFVLPDTTALKPALAEARRRCDYLVIIKTLLRIPFLHVYARVWWTETGGKHTISVTLLNYNVLWGLAILCDDRAPVSMPNSVCLFSAS